MNKNHAAGRLACHGMDDIIFWSDCVFLERHFEVIALQYPDAKFIYNIRPMNDWIKSRVNHYELNNNLKKIWHKPYKLDARGIDVVQFWKSQWVIHDERVREFFRGPMADRVLVFDIMKDGGREIARFLPELEFDDLSFPHAHKTKIKTK